MNEVRAKKALGQHFLVDLNIARKICDALSGGEIVLPAGACGAGAAGKEAYGNGVSGNEVSGNEVSGNEAAGSNVAGKEFTQKGAEPGVVAGDAFGGEPCALAGERAVVAGVPEPAAGCAADKNTASGAATAGRCDVLEVGCGMGVLTQFLLRRDDIVTYGAEIDSESVEYLHAHYPDFAPRLLEGDFLQMNLRQRFPNGLKIIGNFPYNISSQIFFKVLENRDLVPECVGMIQKEVAVRLAEPPGSKEYGILSVLLQAWYDIEYLFTVNETVFNPPPRVKSAVIRLRRNGVERLGCDERLFVKVVKASFGQRRKMIRNSLRSGFGNFGGAEHPFFTQRAEQLSVSDFVELTNWVAANRS